MSRDTNSTTYRVGYQQQADSDWLRLYTSCCDRPLYIEVLSVSDLSPCVTCCPGLRRYVISVWHQWDARHLFFLADLGRIRLSNLAIKLAGAAPENFNRPGRLGSERVGWVGSCAFTRKSPRTQIVPCAADRWQHRLLWRTHVTQRKPARSSGGGGGGGDWAGGGGGEVEAVALVLISHTENRMSLREMRKYTAWQEHNYIDIALGHRGRKRQGHSSEVVAYSNKW